MEEFWYNSNWYSLNWIELLKDNKIIAHMEKWSSKEEAEEYEKGESYSKSPSFFDYTFNMDTQEFFNKVSQLLIEKGGPFEGASQEKPIDPIDRMQNLLDNVTAILTDEQAEQIPQAFTEWKIGVQYSIGARVRYNDILWKCIQEHTSQENWIPSDTPSLWARVHSEEGEILDWVQPLGAEDAYMTGDQVKHLEKTWKSEVDNNVWEPGVYGWVEIN